MSSLMAGFPLEPQLTAAILAAGEPCFAEMLTIIILVTGESILNVPGTRERREVAEQVHIKFAASGAELGEHTDPVVVSQRSQEQ